MKEHTDGYHICYQEEGRDDDGEFFTKGGIVVPKDYFLYAPKILKEIIIHIAAEAAENAYRRGFQQGHASRDDDNPNEVIGDLALAHWRFDTMPGIAVHPDKVEKPYKMTAIARLLIEMSDLQSLLGHYREMDGENDRYTWFKNLPNREPDKPVQEAFALMPVIVSTTDEDR